MSFNKKRLKLSIQLAAQTGTNQPNTFAESGTNQLDVEGLRTSVRVQNAGAVVGSTAQVLIRGLTPSVMNQLSTLGIVLSIVPLNQITIQAAEGDGSFSTVFTGTIWAAYGDYGAQPDVAFHFECLATGAQSVISAPVTSTTTSTDFARIMSGIAQQMGLTFENNGVSAQLPPVYLTGAPMVQARKLAELANVDMGVVGTVLAVFPKGGNRATPNPPLISPGTGMISSPSFTQQGMIVKTSFNKDVSFGSLVTVKSQVSAGIAQAHPQANLPQNSQWAVYKLDHELDAMMPDGGGQWMSTLYCYNPNFQPPLVQK